MVKIPNPLFFVSSNKVKAKEYKEYGLPFEARPGPDIEEPMGNILYVAAYKAYMSGPGSVVEDTGLEVEGADVGVLIRYLEDEADRLAGRRARYQVALGVNDGNDIRVYFAEVTGRIVKNQSSDAYGFDGNFIPEKVMGGDGRTLHEMVLDGDKSKASPRKLVVQKFLDNEPALIISGGELGQAFEGMTLQQDDIQEAVKADLLAGRLSDIPEVRRSVSFEKMPFDLAVTKWDFYPEKKSSFER